jgi:hypothetical protein
MASRQSSRQRNTDPYYSKTNDRLGNISRKSDSLNNTVELLDSEIHSQWTFKRLLVPLVPMQWAMLSVSLSKRRMINTQAAAAGTSGRLTPLAQAL